MTRYRDVVLFFVLSVTWGASFVAIEIGLDEFPPILFAALRLYVGAVILLAYVFVRDSDPWPRTRSDALAVAAGGVLLVFSNTVFLFLGQLQTTGSVAAIIYSLAPVLTTGFAAFLLGGVSLSRVDALGIGLGLTGVALVARPDPATFGANGGTGELLVLVAVVSVALGSVLVQRAAANCSPLAVTSWAVVLGAVGSHLTSVALGEPFDVAASPRAFGSLVFLGVVASAFGYAIYFTLLDRIGPFQISLISYVIPPVAAVTGWLLIGESLAPLSIVGFVVIFVSFLLVKREAIRAELG